jgi:hypothetical protein
VIVDAHAHIVVRAAAAGPERAGSWRPQVTEVAGRSRIHHGGRELTSVAREFTDPGRMAAEAAAQGIGHLLLSPWVRLLPFEHPLAEAREICQVQTTRSPRSWPLIPAGSAPSVRYHCKIPPPRRATCARWSLTGSPGWSSRPGSTAGTSARTPSGRSARLLGWPSGLG